MQHGTSPAEIAGSPLQRLLLLHLNLAQLCTGKELGESASLEELGEQILYYHQDPVTATATENQHQEAIQLAGLCTALYNLPSTLNTYLGNRNNAKSSSDEDDDAVRADDLTQTVELDQSTLIFVPLEDWCTKNGNDNRYYPMILCVVQVARSSTYGMGGNSLAIRNSVVRWHQLFCLLRGGGIHTRLSSNANATAKKMTQAKCAYPGMDQWFKGLKTKRQLRETIRRLREPDLDLDLEHDSLQADLDTFQKTLPILSLREDLKFHYDAYIGDYALISSKEGGVGRCLVDTIPPPSALHDGSHASSWTPENPPPSVSYCLGQAIIGLLSKTDSSKNGGSISHPGLLAVSTFFRGQPLYHHSDDGDFEESNESDSLLMWYFASYSYEVNQQQQNQQTFAASTTSRRMSHGLVSFSDHVSASTDTDLPKSTDPQNFETANGSLLGRPPLAMLSASEQKTAQVMGPHGEWVWAPLVSYGRCFNGEATTKQEAWLAHVILYEWNDFRFLLFVSPTSQSDTSKTGAQSFHSKTNGTKMAELLDLITTTLADALNVVMPQASPLEIKTLPSGIASLKSPGRDIVFIDRSCSQSIVFPRCEKAPSNSRSYASPTRIMHRFWTGPPSSPHTKREKTGDAQNGQAWAKEGLDCRHWLTSRLSPETVLAFDDVINEVSHHRRLRMGPLSKGNHGSLLGEKYEVLTTISGGWVYAFADQEDRELYIYLDSKDYVTIADAEKSIREVHGVVLHEFIA